METFASSTKEQMETMVAEYEREVRDWKAQFELDTKARLAEVEEVHSREERLLTSAIYELGAKVNELTAERKRGCRKTATGRLSRVFQADLSNTIM